MTLGVDLAVLDGPDELDEVLAVVEDVEADLLDPVGRPASRAAASGGVYWVSIAFTVAVARSLGQVAEEQEVVAGHDLGLRAWDWPVFHRSRPAASIFWSRSFGLILAIWPRRTCSGEAAYDSKAALGSMPASSSAPSLTHCSILAMASSARPVVAPLAASSASPHP